MIQPEGGIPRCPDDAPEGCICDVACDLRFERTGLAPEGDVVVRYPFVEVDGIALTIAPDGRVTRCRYSRLGAPEQTVERTCALDAAPVGGGSR